MCMITDRNCNTKKFSSGTRGRGRPFAKGRGIAAALVKAAYDYALDHDLLPAATCRYATVWLDRNPQYKDKVSSMK